MFQMGKFFRLQLYISHYTDTPDTRSEFNFFKKRGGGARRGGDRKTNQIYNNRANMVNLGAAVSWFEKC